MSTDPIVPDHIRAAIHAGHVGQVVIYCDGCGVENVADCTGATREDRFAAARKHLADTAGWTITPETDLCPACAARTPAEPTTLPADVLAAAHDAAAQKVSEMSGWDYNDQAHAAVDAALPHIAAHYTAARTPARTDQATETAAAQLLAYLRQDTTTMDQLRAERDQALADVTRIKTHLNSEQDRLRGHLVRTRNERDDARAELDGLQTLVAAATAWRRTLLGLMDDTSTEEDALADAVDALPSVGFPPPITEPRVLAALESLGWPDDRTADDPSAQGKLYEAAEDAIRAADAAAALGSPPARAQETDRTEPAAPVDEPTSGWPAGGHPLTAARPCVDCDDDIWPGEHAYPTDVTTDDVRCVVCEVTTRRSIARHAAARRADTVPLVGDGHTTGPAVHVDQAEGWPVRHASPGCACGTNSAGQRYVDPICQTGPAGQGDQAEG